MNRVLSTARAAALGILLSSSSALAEDPAACLDASSKAQDLRLAKQLIDARAQLLACARVTCPGVVQRDCAQWLAEVDVAIPTVVIAVKDAVGADVIDARVTVDGKPFLDRITGTATALDPGPHGLHVETATGAQLDVSIVVREGEKNRLLELTLAAPPPKEPIAAPVVATPPPNPAPPPPSTVTSPAVTTSPSEVAIEPAPRSRRKLLGYSAIGVGGAAIIVGVVFGVRASSKWSDAKDACADGCLPGSDAYQLRADARSAATVSTVGMIVGGVAVAGGIVLVLTAHAEPRSTVARGVVGAASQGVLGFGGQF